MAVQASAGIASVALGQLARNPNDVVAPADSAPFQLTLVAVTWVPDCVTVALHAWVITWPLANVQVTRQPVIGVVPELRTVTPPWKPPDHCPATVYVAAQARPPTDGEADEGRDEDGLALGERLADGDVDGERETDGETDGEADGELEGDADGDPLPPEVV